MERTNASMRVIEKRIYQDDTSRQDGQGELNKER